MNGMKKIKIGRTIRSFFRPRLFCIFLSEDPDIIEDNKLYVIGNYGYQWRAIMKCPCGCKEIIYLNLDKTTSPSWYLYNQKKGPTLYPSVWRQKGCHSHFCLIKGKIKWLN